MIIFWNADESAHDDDGFILWRVEWMNSPTSPIKGRERGGDHAPLACGVLPPPLPDYGTWDEKLRWMYLYDFKFNPPSDECDIRIAKGTHKDYSQWLHEPLGSMQPPKNIEE